MFGVSGDSESSRFRRRDAAGASNLRATIAIGSRIAANQLEAGVDVISPGFRPAWWSRSLVVAQPGGRAAWRSRSPPLAVNGSLRDFDLRLTYQAYRARSHRLHARWNLEDLAYALDL